jgi:hypothetical protein
VPTGGHSQRIVDRNAAAVAGAVAAIAADRPVQRQPALAAEALPPVGKHRFGVGWRREFSGRVQVVAQQFLDLSDTRLAAAAAVRAKLSHQPLRQHAEQRVGEVERVHAHVGQPRHGFRRAVGVQRRRLARAGRVHAQQQAIGPHDQVLKVAQVARGLVHVQPEGMMDVGPGHRAYLCDCADGGIPP